MSAADPHRDALLRERVRGCVPLRHPAFGSLLQLLAIEVTDAVPTAAVTVGHRSRLLLNPAFVAQRCRTDAHLSMLVMHELYHVLLGHTRLARRATLAANWAFDCVINAQLCRLHPSVEYTSFFSAGAAADGPWSLIAPPPGWPQRPRWAEGVLGDVHRRLYDDDGVTTAELFALLQSQRFALAEDDAARLLGNHDAEPDGDPLAGDPELMGEVRRIVARWPMVERVGGRDDGGDPTEIASQLARDAAVRRGLRKLLRDAAHGSAAGPSRPAWTGVQALTPLPQPRDRRGQLQRLLGAQPLLWQGVVQQEARDPTGHVAVYLDVSGSMDGVLPVLLDALTSAASLVRWPLFGFSTQVQPVTRAQIAAGRYRSTGGTSITCVAAHLLEQRFRRAVVITDGDAGLVPTALLERLKRARPRVRVGLIDTYGCQFATQMGWSTVRMPK